MGIDPFLGKVTSQKEQDEMEIFLQRNKLFDVEKYKGKNCNQILEK
jgi:hypothetical protein